MANRYWVGGAATWDATAGTKWALTSGGTGGEAVPTAADDVFFDAASGAVTVTTSGTTVMNARSLDFTGFTGTFNHLASTTVRIGDASGGAFTAGSGMTYTIGDTTTSILEFVSSSTNGGNGWNITSNGKSLPRLNFEAAGHWKLQGSLDAAWILMSNGTLDTNSVSVALGLFSSGGTVTTKTLKFGSSSISVSTAGSGNFNGWGNGSVVVEANTATLSFLTSGAQPNFSNRNWNGLNVQFANSSSSAILGNGCTINSLTINGSSNTSAAFVFGPGVTLTGNLTVSPSSSSHTRRVLIGSNGGSTGLTMVPGTPVTLTVNGVISASYADFQDIIGAGSASWDLSGIAGGAGDAGGNSGITFTTPTTRYGVVAGNWSSTGMWSTSSGGSSGASVPLCHDDVYFNASSAAGTYTMDVARLGKNLDFTGFTRTLAYIPGPIIYGSLNINDVMSNSAKSTFQLAGRGTHTITSNAYVFNGLNLIGTGSYTLQDAFLATSNFTHTRGGFDSNNQSMSVATFSSSTSNTRSVTLGTSSITLNGTSVSSATVWNFATTTELTFSGTSSTISITGSGTTSLTFAGGALTYGTLNYTYNPSTHPLIISGSNTFNTVNIGAGHQVNLTAATTQNVTTWSVTGEVRDYVYLSNLDGNSTGNAHFITTPDHNDFDLTGGYDFIVKIAPLSWTGTQCLISKTTTLALNTSYRLILTSSGALTVEHYTTNTGTKQDATSTANLPTAAGVTAGSTKWVRAARTGSTVQFFYGDDGSSWTQLGDNVTESATLNSGTGVVCLGAVANATSSNAFFTGKMYRAIIKSSQDGTVVGDFNASLKSQFSDTYADVAGTSKTWTLNGAAAIGDGRVKIISTTGGTAGYISTLRSDSLGNQIRFIGACDARSGYLNLTSTAGGTSTYGVTHGTTGLEIICKIALDSWATEQGLIAKTITANTGQSFKLGILATGAFRLRMSSNGTSDSAVDSTSSTGFSAGSTNWIKVTWRKSDGRVQFWTSSNGSSWNKLGNDMTMLSGSDIFNSSLSPILIGQGAVYGFSQMAGKVYNVSISDTIDGTPYFNVDFTTMTNQVYHPIIFCNVQLQDNYINGAGLAYAV